MSTVLVIRVAKCTFGLVALLSQIASGVSTGSSPAKTDLQGQLISAVAGNDEAGCLRLLHAGAGLNLRDSLGLLPIDVVRSVEMARFLLTRGASPNLKDGTKFGWRPLEYAAHLERVGVSQLLIDRGADVNGVDRVGCTALFAAALRGRDGEVQFLLKHGADKSLRDAKGETALEALRSYEYKHALQFEGLVDRFEKCADLLSETPLRA